MMLIINMLCKLVFPAHSTPVKVSQGCSRLAGRKRLDFVHATFQHQLLDATQRA
jgi:hypothetical protein